MAISKANRRDLESRLNSIEKELDTEVDEISGTLKKGVKTALIAGGVLAGGYLLLSLLSGDDENEEEEEIKNKPGESLTSILASIGAAVALEAGKDWLEDYLEKE